MKITGLFVVLSAATAFSQVGSIYTDHTISTVAVPINNWNMNSSRNHYITLDDYSNPKRPKYLNPQNIVGVEAVIRDDVGGKLLNFTGHRAGNFLWGGWFHLHCYTYNNACQIQLDRGPKVASRFANTEYDASGPRGYVLIQYHSADTTVQAVHTHWQELGSWSMNNCAPGSFCLNPGFPSEINPAITANIGADIHSDYESIPPGAHDVVTIGHFENLSAHTPNEYSFGKGGVLQMGTLLRFFMPFKEMNQGNYFSRFKTTRYDGSSNRGYMKLQYVRSTTANGRQPFVIKSKYRQIGPWCFSDPQCNSNKKIMDASNLVTHPERIVAVNSTILSDRNGTSPFAVTNIRRGNEREDTDLLNTAGGKIQGEAIANVGPGYGTFYLELNNPAATNKHWGRWPHASSQNRGWIKTDYLAAKCGEGYNGWFHEAANIGFTSDPAYDCNGFADVNGTRTHVLESQGNDIFNGSDQFRYIYRLGGSPAFTFVGKIDQVERSSDWSRGCLMIRKVVNGNPAFAGSPNAAVCRLGSGMPVFQSRAGDGGTTTRTNPSATKVKYKWAKLVLSNNTITGYIANRDDNWNPNTSIGWEQIGSLTNINWSTNYSFGLGASSNDAYNPATVGFVGVNWW